MSAAALKNMPLISRFEESIMPVPESGCWLWLRGLNTTGYGVIKVGGRDEKAHRASWEIYKGPIPRGSKVLHRCDVRSCVNPAHLFLGSQADNVRDMMAKGRGSDSKGERNANSKITAAQASEIRNSTLTLRELAEIYPIKKSMLSNIKQGKNWSDA